MYTLQYWGTNRALDFAVLLSCILITKIHLFWFKCFEKDGLIFSRLYDWMCKEKEKMKSQMTAFKFTSQWMRGLSTVSVKVRHNIPVMWVSQGLLTHSEPFLLVPVRNTKTVLGNVYVEGKGRLPSSHLCTGTKI